MNTSKNIRKTPLYLKNMLSRLDGDQRDALAGIFAPTVVGVPLADARRDVCVLPSGEIRSYECPRHEQDGVCAYLSSLDGGISWTRGYSRGKMNACTYIEDGGVYLAPEEREDGLYIKRSLIGPDDGAPERIKVASGSFACSFMPMQSPFGRRIWFTSERVVGSGLEDRATVPVFAYSDDLGDSWVYREIPFLAPAEIRYPDEGLRWCRGSGNEPHAVLLEDGKMMMIIRTPLDAFYVSYSFDGGDSWSEPAPSSFYGTNTTAYLLRLSDGRILALWNNTVPLAQPDHRKTRPSVDAYVMNGMCEGGFTNRDAAHAAISADGGKSFVGYREILLNPIRANTDFRYIGGVRDTFDKSVHQFQAFELPLGKVLVVLGQNAAARRMVIFDVDWLYETARSEDFVENALSCISTHTYVKSIYGHSAHVSGNGHCSLNRAPSAYLMPDPDGSLNEVLSISKHHDERLHNDIGGATWNFPMKKAGRVTLRLKLAEQSARVVLSDRWYNPSDPHAAERSPFSFELGASSVGTDYVTLTLDYDVEAKSTRVSADGRLLFTVPMARPVPTGISYLVLQCATEGDSEGFYVRSLSAE